MRSPCTSSLTASPDETSSLSVFLPCTNSVEELPRERWEMVFSLMQRRQELNLHSLRIVLNCSNKYQILVIQAFLPFEYELKFRKNESHGLSDLFDFIVAEKQFFDGE